MVWWATVDTLAMEGQLPHPWCTQWHTRSLTPSTLSPTLSASTISPKSPPTPTSTASTMTTPAPPSSRLSLTMAPVGGTAPTLSTFPTAGSSTSTTTQTMPQATSPRSPTTAPPLTLTSSVLDTEWSATLLPIPLPMPSLGPLPSDMPDTVLSESKKFIYVFMFNKDINLK